MADQPGFGTWPPPIGTRVAVIVQCCNNVLGTSRVTWTGEAQSFTTSRPCPDRGFTHYPTFTFSWSQS